MQLKQIQSFQIDHEKLFAGLYVSRKDEFRGVTVTTFDIRITAPNKEQTMDSAAMHTIEHLGATFLRSSERADEIVYFGPMGCKTGFYLVMFGDLTSRDVLNLVKETFEFISRFEGAIPGATPKECGNYSFQNLALAKVYAEKYLKELKEHERLVYPT